MHVDLTGVRATRRDLLRVAGFGAAAAVVGVGPRLVRGASLQGTPAAGAASGDWPTFGYDYQQTRHVPFTQITKDNITQLGRAWSFDFRKANPDIPSSNESFPIIVDGTLYVTTNEDHVFAFDAKTGDQRWHWAPKEIGFFKNFGLTANRGVAYGDGKVYLLTLDMRIIAIDAKTGQTVKQVNISDAVPGAKAEFGYYETTAPVYYKGNLYIGDSGSDNGVRGFFMAYKGSDLSQAWANPLWTVPPAGQGWRKQGNFHGGGTPWMPGTIDPETDILYFCTGNPSPDLYGAVRPGNNPNVDSIFAVKALTGEQLWVRQSISRDLWDYDMAASPVLMTATVDGEKRKVVAEGSKAGQWWCWDAASGQLLYDGVPFAKIDHPEPTAQGVLVYPGAGGGANYAPQAYDPTTNYYLICNMESPSFEKVATKEQVERRAQGDVDFGGTFNTPENVTPYGTYVAIDMDTGKVVYSKKRPGPLRSGFTTTATGLGFFGGTTNADANLHAIDTKSGDILWSFGVGAGIMAAPSIYTIDGEEYVACTVGDQGSTVSRLDVFKLGGNQTQATPVATPVAAVRPIPSPDQFIVPGPQHNSVTFNAVAAYSDNNNGMNFNGYGNGQLTLTVPVGWVVMINLWNKSDHMAHSIMVTTQQELSKGSNFTAAFVGAYAPADPVTGFIGKQVETLQTYGGFSSDKPGTYVMLCAVPGHAAQGMWDYLKFDASATAPSLTTPNGTQQMATPAAGATPAGM